MTCLGGGGSNSAKALRIPGTPPCIGNNINETQDHNGNQVF